MEGNFLSGRFFCKQYYCNDYKNAIKVFNGEKKAMKLNDFVGWKIQGSLKDDPENPIPW